MGSPDAHHRAAKKNLLAGLTQAPITVRRVTHFLEALCALNDQTLTQLFHQCGLADSLTLVAVGGYGRGQLYPYSDVDVLVLMPSDVALAQDDALRGQVERFISQCWDAGMEVGSSVRTVEECMLESAKDVTVQTSLLEARWVCGQKGLFAEFQRRYAQAMDAKAFFVAKTLEMRQRHTKFENTPYALEPNCKESPGGLRDLHILKWVAKAAGLGHSWSELARSGLVTAHEARQLTRNEQWLSLVRVLLHLEANRREDRLVFDLQSALGLRLGLGQNPDGSTHARQASEALMKRYYWAAKAVTQLNQIVVLNLEEQLIPGDHTPHPINERFANKSGMLDVRTDEVYLQQPHAILETFWLYQTTPGIKGLSSRTLRALYNARPVMDAQFRKDPANHAMFVRILQSPLGITHAMRLMNQTSVLGRYLWTFRRIVGQMQHDLFHVYTVDQHILMVLRNVRRFFIAEHAHEYPFCSQLASGWDKPWLFYVAALFHDIAKGRGKDHSVEGRMEVRRFCCTHQITGEDASLVEFLVSEHLTMSHVAQKEDLNDPEVIAQFARRVGSERQLTALYLLTVADIRGTSPKVWNAWKGKLLEDLYKYTARAMGGRAPDPDSVVEARKREALENLALHALPHEAHKSLWDSLDVGYFMRHDAQEIAWHTRQLSRWLSQNSQDTPPAMVRCRPSPTGEGLQIMVFAPDAPDLFARICGYFDHNSISVQDAKIYTAPNGRALDTFQVVAPHMSEHYRELSTMVERDLADTLALVGPLPTASHGRVSRRVKSFPIAPRVNLQPDEKAQRWLLSVSASDRVGLLYGIARVLARHQIHLQLAKISTLGERVEDTFLIDGPSLQHNRSQIDIETELLESLSVQ